MKKQPTNPSPRKNADVGPLLLPAVKGRMGNREYVLCSMPAEELVKRVILSIYLIEDGNKDGKKPSKKLQRDLKEPRLDEIADYLKEDHRFFNALVIAVCGGNTEWRGFSQLNGKGIDSKSYKDKIGFLSLSGEEKLYALDGQHRLEGIRKALQQKIDVKDDEISVIIVQHDDKQVQTGLKQSRRLFTALNKHAKSASKRDIIYLDEDDLAAMVVRELVEKEEYEYLFMLGKRIHESPANQFYSGEVTSCYTTIGAFYDCVQMLLAATLNTTKEGLNKNFPSDKDIQIHIKKHCSMVTKVFTKIAGNVPAMKKYFAIKNTSQMENFIKEHEKKHVLFRPAGLKILIKTVCAYYKKHEEEKSIEECMEKCCELSFDMNTPPLANLVWNIEKQRIIKGFSTLEGIYLHMLNLTSEKQSKKILEKYQKAIDNGSAKLPDKL